MGPLKMRRRNTRVRKSGYGFAFTAFCLCVRLEINAVLGRPNSPLRRFFGLRVRDKLDERDEAAEFLCV